VQVLLQEQTQERASAADVERREYMVAFGMPHEQNAANAILDAIDEADKLIGDLVVPPVGDGFLDPSVTGPLTEELTTYNETYDCD
jgi:hypothetical protein